LNPPFTVPTHYLQIFEDRLRKTTLVGLYKLNEQDFIDGVGLFYDSVIKDPDPGALVDPVKGFNTFCDYLTGFLLGTDTQLNKASVDEKGNLVNLFGTECLKSLNLKAIQNAYASYGDERNSEEWRMTLQFAGYLAVQAFKHGIGEWDAPALAAAASRRAELSNGTRKLRSVPRRFFGKSS
jgi:hypothetical protein